MPELVANPNYSWDETLRELKHDDGSDKTLDFVDIIAQEILDKTKWLHTNKTFAVKATLDATGGLAIGAHGLGITIPGNAIIVRTFYDVLTTFTSATDAATIALHAEAADDIIAAVAISAATDWDAGLHDGLQDNAAANMIKITADDVSIIGEAVGTGDGSEDAISYTLFNAQNGPIVPGTLNLEDGTQTVGDDGAGALTGDATGTIDYVTGEISGTWTAAPADAAAITVDYDYVPDPGPGRELTATVAVEDLTDGKLILFVEYVVSEMTPL